MDEPPLLPAEMFPPLLREIPQPPETLFYRGVLPDWNDPELKFLCIIGTRKWSSYGKLACETLIEGLRGQNIVIISGLALGIDAIAHEAALRAGLPALAVPGSGLGNSVLYPRTNYSLAQRILKSGGCLLSEFAPDFRATVWSFPQRNRIMAGLSHAVLLIEAEDRSGSLITTRLATDYNRDVLAVPGPINSPTSGGPHLLIRLGATPIRHAGDIIEALHLPEREETESALPELSKEETEAYDVLVEPRTVDEISSFLKIPIATAGALLSMLELKDAVRIENGRASRSR